MSKEKDNLIKKLKILLYMLIIILIIDSVIMYRANFGFLFFRKKLNQKMDIDEMNKLMKMGADINVIDNNGKPPLLDALYSYNMTTAKFLIENGANVNARTWRNETPFTYAIRNINFMEDIAKLMLDHGAKVEYKNLMAYNYQRDLCTKSIEFIVNLLPDEEIEKINMDTNSTNIKPELQNIIIESIKKRKK